MACVRPSSPSQAGIGRLGKQGMAERGDVRCGHEGIEGRLCMPGIQLGGGSDRSNVRKQLISYVKW